MKLNKKLLMAALAGAIVVGGGVNTYAVEDKGPGMYEQEEGYKAKTEKEVANELKAAKAAAKRHIDSLSHLSEKAKELAKKDIESSTAEKDIDGIVARADVMERKLAEKENPGKEEEGKISDSWFNPAEHPFAFRTKAEAEEAAKKALENELLNPGKINKSYKVSQKADGNWEYVLSPNLPETPETPKPGKEEKPGTSDVTPSKPERQPSTPEGPYAPYEPSTPGKEDKKPGEDKKPETKKPEDKKPGEDKKPEEKKPEDKKPGEDKKPEDKKPGKKENTDSPNKKNKKKLPKAGSEAEILTLAAASLSSVAGAFISLKKRK